MLLTRPLLERMRNNVMVLEVWDKKTTAERDQVRVCQRSHLGCSSEVLKHDLVC